MPLRHPREIVKEAVDQMPGVKMPNDTNVVSLLVSFDWHIGDFCDCLGKNIGCREEKFLD